MIKRQYTSVPEFSFSWEITVNRPDLHIEKDRRKNPIAAGKYDEIGRRHGTWWFFSTKGATFGWVCKTEEYEHGVLHGQRRLYGTYHSRTNAGPTLGRVEHFERGEIRLYQALQARTGAVIRETEFKGGKKHGFQRAWTYHAHHGCHVLLEEIQFSRGQVHGCRKLYTPDGKLRAKSYFKNGLRHGPEIIYRKEKVFNRKFYRGGKAHGWEYVYHSCTGQVIRRTLWQDDLEVRTIKVQGEEDAGKEIVGQEV